MCIRLLWAVCRAFLSLNAGETCSDGRSPRYGGSGARNGNDQHFITVPCSGDADCCELNANLCHAFLPSGSTQAGKDGWIPGIDPGNGVCGGMDITGPSNADVDCGLGCCQLNLCLSLNGAESYQDGQTTRNGQWGSQWQCTIWICIHSCSLPCLICIRI